MKKCAQVRTLRDIYNMSRKWIVKGEDTPLDVELELKLDEDSNLVTVKVLGENIADAVPSSDHCHHQPVERSLFVKGVDDDKE